MATDILIKRSTTPGAVPTTGDLSTGELAINTADKRLFTNNSGTIVEIGTAPTTQAVTGNATVGGTLGVTGNTTLTTVSTSGAATLASGSVTGNFSVAGTLTVATPTNSTDAASKGYVDTAVANVIDSAPAALDTLNELAAALNDDANFATTVTTALATKLNLSGGTMTGDITLGANNITSTATPATADTLTRKGYVDSILGSATDAATSAAAAAVSETNAANSASAASTSASNASTSATNAASSASAASTSASNAATSATASANSATASANSATAAATSATNAATSEANAAASYDSFDDRYLGAKASAPTLDNDGDALITGALYFNSTSNNMFVWTGSVWQDVDPSVNAVQKTSDTGSAEMPAGTTAQRDGSPSAGYLRFNSDESSFEGYDGSAWGAIGGGGGATGGSTDAIFWENDQTVTTSYTITASKNAMTAGPVDIASGVTVTIPTGSRWLVL